jgi:hypothetical protein
MWPCLSKKSKLNCSEASMKDVENWLALFGGMSGGTLAVLVILGAFALAGFAIYAVLTLARKRQ